MLSMGARAANSKGIACNELEEGTVRTEDGHQATDGLTQGRVRSRTLGSQARVNGVHSKASIQDPSTCKKGNYI